MIATNNTPGHDRIEFAIPQSEWQLQWLLPGRAVVKAINTFCWIASNSVTIDGTSQTAFTGDTNPGGCEVTFYGGPLNVNGDASEVTGLDSVVVNVSGDNSLVHQLTGNTNISLFDSHGTVIQNNSGVVIKVDRSNDVTVISNTVLGVRVLVFVSKLGSGPILNTRIGGPTLAERNFITGLGSYDGEGFPSGSAIQIFDATGAIVENNWIGTTIDGMSSGSVNATAGISFSGENHDVLIKNNRIAGVLGIGIGPHAAGLLFGTAVLVSGTGSDIEITGNTIGLYAAGEPVLGSVTGIEVSDFLSSLVQHVTIGGANAGDGNEIAGHLFNGVTIERTVSGVLIAGNSIHSNNQTGIDLNDSGFNTGVSPNDSLDADTGGNGVQNFPVLATAAASGAMVHITGALESTPNQVYTVEFFASADCDGEGERFLGRTDVTTDGGGMADIHVTIMSPVLGSEWITATATATDKMANNTSEFSACIDVTDTGACVGDATDDSVVDIDDLNMILSSFGASLTIGDPRDIANDDGMIDINDLYVVLANFGAICD